jgi:2'-5' RNA ligase
VKNKTRQQLTLFINEHESVAIENIRKLFNPKQYALIKSHVTLCREDEIDNIERVISNLKHLNHKELSITLYKVERFEHGKGVMLSTKGDNIAYHTLRKQILHGLNSNPRKQNAHITLMHPSNSACTDAIFSQIEKMHLPIELKFKTISLIEQKDGRPWETLQTFNLNK